MASESGVDLRTFNLSSSKDWLLGANPEGPPLGGLLGFPLVELILCEELSRLRVLAFRRLKLLSEDSTIRVARVSCSF